MSRYVLIFIVLLLAGCGGASEGESPVEADRPPEASEETGVTVEAAVSPTLGPSATATEPARTGTATETAVPSMMPTAGGMEQTTLTVPAQCLPEQGERFPYVNHTAGYCLQYPASFQIGDVFPEGAPNVENILAIYGPSYDQSLEPLRAGMNIVVAGPAEGRTLDEVVEETVSRSVSDVSTEPAELGGEPAVILQGLSGRTENRKLITIYEGRVYEVTVYPTGDEFPEVAGDVETVWQTVLDSFTFLAQDVLAQFDACPDEASPYVDVAAGYCSRYPSQFRLVQATDPPAVTFVDTLRALGPNQEPVRVELIIEREEVAAERTLQELADQLAADYPEAAIRERPAELGGEAAIVVDGLPEEVGDRRLLALHQGAVYRLSLSTLDDGFPEAAEAAEGVWDAVTESFAFLR